MRTEVIKADTIEEAVERILKELGADARISRENAIYFDGWDGLGAAAVLQAVAERLAISNELAPRPPELQFEKIIHVDCSKWESKRAMQRAIAEQLELPSQVMDMFDKQDDEDDFNGLDLGSRGLVAQVTQEIIQTVQNRRFLMILHNGSDEEIDIINFGLYLYGYANSKMLCTFQGRFRLDTKMRGNVKKGTTTGVFLSASSHDRGSKALWSYLVRHEAAQVDWNKHGHGIIDPAMAAECVLYMLKQCCIGPHIVDYDWAIHTNNYWICDGIIAAADIDKAWMAGDAVQRELQLFDIDYRSNPDESTMMRSSHLTRSTEGMPYWISTTTCGFAVMSPTGVIPNDMFRHSHRLGVLKLSRCTFSFSSPPFLCCRSLRFLWLDRCQDLLITRTKIDHHHADADKEDELENSTAMSSWECFQSLLVLDLRYTDWDGILSAEMMDVMNQLRELHVMGAKNWDMSHLRGRLRNMRKLRITESTYFCSHMEVAGGNSLFSEMERLEILYFSGNRITQGISYLSGAAGNKSLRTATIDGCVGLEKISFKGCKELRNLFLKGWLDCLEEMDFSGTTLETIDLRQVEFRRLKRLILVGCEKLRAILWPPAVDGRALDVLRIATTSTISSDGGKEATHVRSSSPLVMDEGEATHAHPHGHQSLQKQKAKMFNRWQISLTDARFLRSLRPIYVTSDGDIKYFSSLHIDICPAATIGGGSVQGKRIRSSNKQVRVQPHSSTMVVPKYGDVLKEVAPANSCCDCDDGLIPSAVMMMWDCPEIPLPQEDQTCIIEIAMSGQGRKLLEGAQSASTSSSLPDFICDFYATSLHVYDNSSVTTVPAPPEGSGWNRLRWCRVDRCSKLHTVFTTPEGTRIFSYLSTFWGSQLLTARYIWNWPSTASNDYENYSFYDFELLHLDYCPRLIHVLPFSVHVATLRKLEIIEIVCCGDLKEIFPLDPKRRQEQKTIIEFLELRRIHLHELPMLQHICGRRMSAPKLETIKIRGCWSLRRLPAVGSNTERPKVDCEKEWWDSLEWDGLEANHHPSLYQPTHSRYYKARLPRVSVLR